MNDKSNTTAEEAEEDGQAACRAGLPCEAPNYGREDRRARWRVGWKWQQAASGEEKTCRQNCGNAPPRTRALAVSDGGART